MTNLFIMWKDVYSEKRGPAASSFRPPTLDSNTTVIYCSRMKMVGKRREPFGRERRKELRCCLGDYAQFTSPDCLGLCGDSLEIVSGELSPRQNENPPAKPSRQV